MTARHGARAALSLGLAASLAGNVIAAEPTALGRLVAAWPPLALLVAIELITRIPSRGGALSVVRLGSAGLLAVIAAWVSYWHLVDLALAAGEGGIAAHLLPLSVDGLVAVASVCLRELGPAAPERPPRPAPAARPQAPERADAVPAVANRGATTSARAAAQIEGPPRSAGGGRIGVGERVRRLAADHPEWTRAELAAAAGCSERSVRRHLAAVPSPGERSLDDEWVELAALAEPAPAEPAPAVPVLPIDPDQKPVASTQEHRS